MLTSPKRAAVLGLCWAAIVRPWTLGAGGTGRRGKGRLRGRGRRAALTLVELGYVSRKGPQIFRAVDPRMHGDSASAYSQARSG